MYYWNFAGSLMLRPRRVVVVGAGSRPISSPLSPLPSATTTRCFFFCFGAAAGFETFLFPFWEVCIAFSEFSFS
ncbi:hypothetical protein BU23DRAFT_147737 [Bimuria novae-zelandiae CBS 107.79]|uniref:Uncharacterized protein n=1 Tax=Bimuria novae-zelandiae CBS 107.79 TaxID=1447943 RepID=A0A6A5VTR2_9PLEO|nr:hypothetical protein BU23DRAFT_147737 [Bimuria novae-zelandiae CBS 107.79]